LHFLHSFVTITVLVPALLSIFIISFVFLYVVSSLHRSEFDLETGHIPVSLTMQFTVTRISELLWAVPDLYRMPICPENVVWDGQLN